MLFGLGTIVGMMLITLILSAQFAFTAINLPEFNWPRRVASVVNRKPAMHAGLFRRCDD
jgi:hypothetical protein